MARNLNLQVNRIENGLIKVSWDDPVKGDFSTGSQTLYGLFAFSGFVLFAFLALSSTLLWLLAAIAWPVGGIVAMNWTVMKPNEVTFGRDIVIHKGRRFDTANVTRFEYGLRSQLTGKQPYKNPQTGESATDPTMIRMWLNDSSAHTISENNWQNQVAHEIRDTLDRALIEVRQKAMKIEREKTHGKTGDFGVPDY